MRDGAETLQKKFAVGSWLASLVPIHRDSVFRIQCKPGSLRSLEADEEMRESPSPASRSCRSRRAGTGRTDWQVRGFPSFLHLPLKTEGSRVCTEYGRRNPDESGPAKRARSQLRTFFARFPPRRAYPPRRSASSFFPIEGERDYLK